MKVALISGDIELDALQGEWDELLEASDQLVFFLRWRWNQRWWRTYAPARSRLYIVTCREEAGRLVGLAPLYWQQRRHWGGVWLREIQFIGTGTGIVASEHLDVVARRGSEAAVGSAVGAFLRGRADWDRLHLWHVPSESTVVPHLRAAVGGRSTVGECDRAAYLSTDVSWDEIKKGFGQNLRTSIDRLVRKVEKAPDSRFERVADVAELGPVLDEFVRLHQLRWEQKGQPGSFSLEQFESFLRAVAHEALADGRLCLWSQVIGGRTVATLLAFADGGTVHYFQSGFDPSCPLSLGKTTIAQAIRDCAASASVRRFDFMGGRDPYKATWTGLTRTMTEVEVLRPTWPARAYVNLRATHQRLSGLRRWMRQLSRRGARAPEPVA